MTVRYWRGRQWTVAGTVQCTSG